MVAGVRCGVRTACHQLLEDTARSGPSPCAGMQCSVATCKVHLPGSRQDIPLLVMRWRIWSVCLQKAKNCPTWRAAAGMQSPRGRRWQPVLSETPDMDGKRSFWCTGPARRLGTGEKVTTWHTKGFLAADDTRGCYQLSHGHWRPHQVEGFGM